MNNAVYRELGHAWWDDDVGIFATLRFLAEPVRFGYFIRVLGENGRLEGRPPSLLDVGCGGGVLAEDFARAGLRVTGIDPAAESIEAAREHARASGLAIEYAVGWGERLPFPDACFDLVACCDVLEHVADPGLVIGEAARVLKPGGMFLYDSVNRTRQSRLGVIKVMQDWRSTAFLPAGSHLWERFITPAELSVLLAGHGLRPGPVRGIRPRTGLAATWLALRQRARGRISFRELGRRLDCRESDDVPLSYLGYAVRSGPAPGGQPSTER